MKKIYFWLVRSVQISTIFTLFAVISYQTISLQKEANAVRYHQTAKFSYSLTNLAAAKAARHLAKDNYTDLKLLVDELIKDPIVRDAVIYDQYGKVVYRSQGSLPLMNVLKIGGSKSNDAEGVIPHIAELYAEEIKIGYIRVSIEQDRILTFIHDYQERGFSILTMLIFLAFIAGSICMALCYKKGESIYLNIRTETQNVVKRSIVSVTRLLQK